MAGAEATVLTIWEPFLDGMIRGGAMGMGMAVGSTAPFADDEPDRRHPFSRRLW